MAKFLLKVLFLMTLSFATCTNAEDSASVTMSSVLQNENIISIVQWNAGGKDLICVLTMRKENNTERLPTRAITVYTKNESNLTKIYEFLTPDFPISMYSLGESESKLFTAWTGGSAHHFYAFAYIDKKIQKVLDVSSKIMPEFVLDKENNEIILVTHLTWENDEQTNERIQVPDTTEIYKWNGKKYERIKTVPWKNRFQYLFEDRNRNGDGSN